jgi:hypothetical protein
MAASAWSANALASPQSWRSMATMPRVAITTGTKGRTPAAVAASRAWIRSIRSIATAM